MAEDQKNYKCGYAPRALRRLPRPKGFDKVLFVGAKDGSVTILRQKTGDHEFRSTYLALLAPGGGRRASVRTLLEWGQDQLLVGRDDGTLDVIRWRDALGVIESGAGFDIAGSDTFLPPKTRLGSGGESVRYATWIDKAQDRLLISYRYAGTRLFSGDIFEALGNPRESSHSLGAHEKLGGIRLAARIAGTPSSFVFIGRKGELWRWFPGGFGEISAPIPLGPWEGSASGKRELPPATFDDATYVGHETSPGLKKIQALIVTTDTGVFALDLRKGSWKSGYPAPVRLALPGGRLFSMAVTYAQTGPTGAAHLWLTNREGESFLFQNAPLGAQDLQTWALGFESSRVVHTDAQALTATSWPDRDRIWLARACRDDQVRVHSYPAEPLPLDRTSPAELLNARCQKGQAEAALELIRRSLEAEGKTSEYTSWPGYALLAEYFEHQAEESSRGFFEYLSRPSTDLAAAILIHEVETVEPEEARRTIRSAIRLWTYTLIGLAHREQKPREELYLGILRFLRGLAEIEAKVEWPDPVRLSLANSVDWAVRFARKWGLYGEVNEIRQDLVRPLAILRQDSQEETPRRMLDRLTYSSLLFRRSYSEVFHDDRKKTPGDHAWATRTLHLTYGVEPKATKRDIDLVAVSWRRSGIAMYVLDPSRAIEEGVFVPVRGTESFAGQPDGHGDDQFAYSRDLLLLERPGISNGFFLLRARRTDRNSPWHRDLECWPCSVEPKDGDWILETTGPSKLAALPDPISGSLYRFLSVGDRGENQLVAVALQGRHGRPEIALVEITPKGGLTILEASRLLGEGDRPEAAGSRTAQSQRNRIWSLARAGRGIIAGSDNGEIWLLQLDPKDDTKVGQLASAVTALEAGIVRGKLRIYAGARDGTVIAFQELDLHTPEPRTAGRRFATLWSTVERSAISYIDHQRYSAGSGSEKEEFDLVLAVTRNGNCLAFDDRPEMGPFAKGKAATHPQQPPFPGIRWMRTAIARTCFAAVSMQNLLHHEGEAWLLLVTASGDGRLDLLSLHYPRYTNQRKREFARHFEDLWNVACEKGAPDDLRVVEATYRSAPLIPLIIVRLFLDPDPGRKTQNAERLERLDGLRRWLMPKFLRPLLDVTKHWAAASSPTTVEAERAVERAKVIEALRALLDAAWKRGDVDLFQEISSLILKQMNFMIFSLDPKDNAEAMKDLYFSLFDTIEGSLQNWLGAGGDKEARARIIVGKNLVDGDTAHRLFSVLHDRNPNDKEDPWRKILYKRIDGIRQLVWKGDPIVSLESLRAANHSLVRICRRLSDQRSEDGAGLTDIRWDLFKDYFEQLVSGAIQALGPNLRLRDALTHEYARTFALCLSACPEGAVRMTGRLAEVRLIVDPSSEDDLAARIEGQIDLLADSFRIIPHAWVKHLFSSSVMKPNLDDLKINLPPERPEWAYRRIGKLREDLNEVERLYGFIAKLRNFAAELAGDLRNRENDESDENDTWKALKEIADSNRDSEIFGHSWRFWGDALGDAGRLKALQTAPLRARIRPEIVHFTRDLVEWAKDWEDKLVARHREERIFQPEFGLYKEVLDRLKRAAQGFPGGAAVQTNLVVGILGHHLLEDLDLHVLELREIARNLDPIAVDAEDPKTSVNEPDSIESAFANLLVRRAERARSLPKNLRTLAKVLNPEGSLSELGKTLGSLPTFVKRACEINDWIPPTWDDSSRGINPRERELLTLMLDELNQNHRYHSGYQRDEPKSKKPVALWDGSRLTLHFPVSAGKERWAKLKAVCFGQGESPCEPSKGGDVPSSGVGIYLSCLAASMIGWEVKLSLDDPARDGSEEGWFIVRIEPRLPSQTRVKDRAQALLPRPVPDSATASDRLAHVVVIDDKAQVALFVWRELGRIPGFGSAEVDAEEAAQIFGANAKEIYEQGGAAKELKTPGEELAVWWVIADQSSVRRLAAVLDRIPPDDPVYFLVDVRGPIGDSKPKNRPYRWEEMVAQIRASRMAAYPHHIHLISSYEHGLQSFKDDEAEFPFPIRDKSPSTLSDLRNEILGPVEKLLPPGNGEIHILVTGAGFELKEAPERQRLGTLRTWKLLEQWAIECFGKDEWTYVASEITRSPKGYPVPKKWLDRSELVVAAVEENLDRYWSLLLEAERSVLPTDLEQAQREYKLRKSFREAFVRDDWGYLGQALAAAGLPWNAWLSTNYTKFADRAIERVGRLEDPEKRIDWRAIEVSEEAERLSLELLHRKQDSVPSPEPTLFKLHGDLGHVLTMAIAGEDKTFLSRLRSFAPLYLAAQACLEVRARHATRVTWHIVGHGLRDELLLQVIERVFRSSPGKHRFVVVDPARGRKGERAEHPGYRLRDQLGDDRLPVRARCASAGLYLTRLKKMGLSAVESVVDALDRPTDWVDQPSNELTG